jgi:hypothetical protein
MDHSANTYLAVHLKSGSPYIHSPTSLALAHPPLIHVGKVGQLDDVQLFSIPKEKWVHGGEELLAAVRGDAGVQTVDVQAPKPRAKRGGGDEL